MITRRTLLATLLALAVNISYAADFNSDRISVRAEGNGSDVILIPGLSSSPRVWTELLKAVPGHRYHLVHVAGFAGMPKGGNGEGLVSAPVAEEIARYIQEQGLKQPAVIGHSMGGTIALMLSARHPDAVSRLMVVDMLPFLGAMFGPPGTTAQSVKPTADAVMAGMRNATPAQRLQKAESNLAGMINTEAMRAGAIDDVNKSDLDVNARSMHELISTDLGPELAKIKVPTSVLYVVPKGVPLTQPQLDGFYKMAYAPIKGVQVKYVPDSAHFIMWDQPAVFQASVKAFLD